MQEEKTLIENGTQNPASLIAGCNQLIKKIPTDCWVFLQDGLEAATMRLPSPNNAVLMYKFQLIKTASDMSWAKKVLDSLLAESSNMDIQFIIEDSISLLAEDEYRVFYDSDIAKAIECCTGLTTDINLDRIKLFRHLQLFMKILEKNNITHLCVYEFNIGNLYSVFSKNLTENEQQSLKAFYGLCDGKPQHLYELRRSIYSNERTHDAVKDLSNAIISLRENQEKFITKRFPHK